LKIADLQQKEGELKKLAPKGTDPLQRRVTELKAKLKDATISEPEALEPLPSGEESLRQSKTEIDSRMASIESQISYLEKSIESAEINLAKTRKEVTRAKEDLAGFEATAKAARETLGRFASVEKIADRLAEAKRELETAQTKLLETELTAEEETIEERLNSCKEAVSALGKQIRENEEKYNRMKGRLEESEGLHSRRAALAARVDELNRLTTLESLEKEAVDRLYELFEECRDKQLGTLIGPVHDRVLNWMRVLDIGDYQELRFSDAFLPEKLVRRDGTAELTIDEESTGAQEQISMLVRLALGSLLTSIMEPTVAILDDPLTHCDVGRLNKMRTILRRASEGDSKLTPPAGPLQIIVLTCHPEWFRDERATVIDLENADVMQRFPV
jgi:DNA repair exonuclease SbcCD ATPase subunit